MSKQVRAQRRMEKRKKMPAEPIHIIDLGEGLYFFQHTFLGSIRSLERRGKIVALGFIDGSTKELSENQSRKLLENFGLERPLIQTALQMPRQ